MNPSESILLTSLPHHQYASMHTPTSTRISHTHAPTQTHHHSPAGHTHMTSSAGIRCPRTRRHTNNTRTSYRQPKHEPTHTHAAFTVYLSSRQPRTYNCSIHNTLGTVATRVPSPRPLHSGPRHRVGERRGGGPQRRRGGGGAATCDVERQRRKTDRRADSR